MPTVQRILVPVDFSACSRGALAYAAFLARSLGAVADALHVWHVPSFVDPELLVNVPGTTTLSLAAHAQARSEGDMREFLAGVAEAAGMRARVEQGDAVEVILETARREAYDMIVMGTHGRRGLSHLLIGSTAERVVRGASCAVVTLRGDAQG